MAETNENVVLTDKEIIEDNEKRFEFFVHFPKVITIILGVICFIAGIALAESTGGNSILYCWFGGALACWITYTLLKLAFSYNILHIYYLKQLVKKSEEKQEVEEKTAE